MYKGKMSSWLFGTMFNKKADLMVPFFTKDTFSKRMTFVTYYLSPIWRESKSLDAVSDLHSQETNLQHPTKPSKLWHSELLWKLLRQPWLWPWWFGWLAYGFGPSYGLGCYGGYGFGYFRPLSSERPDHYLGTQCLSNFHYLILQRCYHHALAAFQIGRCPHLWWMIWMLYQDVVNCSAKWSNLSLLFILWYFH